MTSLAATSYFSHPWFDKPSMKRRHSPSSGEDDALSPPPITAKRRKVAALERGFSNLSLDISQPLANRNYEDPHPSVIPPVDTVSEMEVEDTSMLPSIQPDSVEEPTSPPSTFPEIRMKGPSWYEPEPDRIVITDLDSDDEEEQGQEREPLRPFVSPALLERIRRRELEQQLPPLQNQHALVLYRPIIRNLDDSDSSVVVEEPPLAAFANREPTPSPEVDMMDIE